MWRKPYQVDHQRDAHLMRIVVQTGGAGFILGMVASGSLTGGLVVGAIFTLIGLAFYRVVVVGTADLVANAVLPSRRGGAGAGYSHIEAMEAAGDIAGAVSAWEAVIAANPNAVAARVQAADLHARRGNDPRRAAALFREIQSHPNAPAETQRYASQRLVDLYLGPLREEGRAMVELRKLIDRWPDTPEAHSAAEALRRLKSERAAE